MSERSNVFPWGIIILMLLSLFAYVKLDHSELRDLQRRVGELEQRK